MDAQSRTQLLILRQSYQRHRQRLHSIKQNNTSLQFYSSTKAKPEDRKRLLMMKDKQEEINSSNHLLEARINRIKHRSTKLFDERAQSFMDSAPSEKRIVRQEDNATARIEDLFDANNAENRVRCVFPSFSRPKAYSSLAQQAYRQHPTLQKNIQKAPLELMSSNVNNKITVTLKECNQLIGPSEVELLEISEPEKYQNRIVIYKRTRLIEPMLSCLIELSLVAKQLLIAAYLMGTCSEILTLILDRKKTKDILAEIDGNYQSIAAKVSIQQFGAVWQLRFGTPIERAEALNEQQTMISKGKLQQQFLLRNYYSQKVQTAPLTANAPQQPASNPATVERLNALCQRLSAPKASIKIPPNLAPLPLQIPIKKAQTSLHQRRNSATKRQSTAFTERPKQESQTDGPKSTRRYQNESLPPLSAGLDGSGKPEAVSSPMKIKTNTMEAVPMDSSHQYEEEFDESADYKERTVNNISAVSKVSKPVQNISKTSQNLKIVVQLETGKNKPPQNQIAQAGIINNSEIMGQSKASYSESFVEESMSMSNSFAKNMSQTVNKEKQKLGESIVNEEYEVESFEK